MKRLAPLVLAIPLFLGGCGGSQEQPAPVTVTESTTVTATTQSAAEREESLRRSLNANVPIRQVNDENLRHHCIMAIGDELPDAGDFDFPEPIEFSGGEGSPKQIYTSGGNFRYEDAQDVFQDGAYFCTVTTQDGVIEEATAVAL